MSALSPQEDSAPPIFTLGLAAEMSAATTSNKSVYSKARAMAVTSPERWPVLPDTPAVAEAVKGYEAENWYGLAAPHGTPQPIVERLNTAIAKVFAEPDVKKKYEENGLTPALLSPADYVAFLKRDSVTWGDVVRKGNIKLDE